MNKIFIPLMAVAMILFCGCGDDKDTDTQRPVIFIGGGGGGGDNGGDDGDDDGDDDDDDDDDILPNPGDPLPGADAMSPEQQQVKMQQVGQKALSYVSANDFRYWRDLAEYVDDHYIDNEYFDNDVVEDFFENLVTSTEIAGSHRQDHQQETYDWSSYVYHYITDYTEYKNLLLLSNICGHFTAGNSGWTKQSANDLQFIFRDQNGSNCVAKLTTSGNKQTVHLMDIEDTDYQWYFIGSDYYSYNYVDYDKYYVEIPEQINVTFTVGGTQRMSADIRLNVSGIQNQTIDIEKLAFNASAVLKLDQYQFKTTNIAYKPNSAASTQFEFCKGNTTIATVKVSAGEFKTSGMGGDITQEDTWDHIADFGSVSGGQAQITLDVLGELQVNANFRDFDAIRQAAQKLEDDDHDEAAYKRDVQALNSLMTAGLYYDRTSTLQANFLLKAFEEKDWYYDGYGFSEDRYWQLYPVIRFGNGHSYSLFEESSFFNESSFKSLIDMAENLLDDFEELFDF